MRVSLLALLVFWGGLLVLLSKQLSLESYILNGALPRMMISLFVFAGNPLIGNVLPYLAACVIGTAVGWGIHNFSDKIIGLCVI